MKLNFKIIVLILAVLMLAQACKKRCKTFDADGTYTASIYCQWSKSGPYVTPEGWDTTYTDVLTITTSDSPYDLSIQNWPDWGDARYLRKITAKFELKSGESDQSNTDTKPKECFETAFWEEPSSLDSEANILIGKNTLSYSLSEAYGGSGGRITKTCTIKANR